MENKVMMPPPPKNLKNMPPLPPRPNMPKRPTNVENVQVSAQKQTAPNSVMANALPPKKEVVKEEAKREKTLSVAEEVEVQKEKVQEAPQKESGKGEKSSGGSKFLYWLGFFLCLIGMGAAVYFLMF